MTPSGPSRVTLTPAVAAAIRQSSPEAGVIDLRIGQPDPALLPVAGLRAAAAAALDTWGADALAYGAERGPGPLLEWLGGHLGRLEGRSPAPDELVASAGISHAIDLVATAFARPGDTCLVAVPTFHLALAILRDHGLDVVGVPSDAEGMTPAGLASAARRVRAAGGRPVLAYVVSAFANPTGTSLTRERGLALADAAASSDVMLVEDAVYQELAFDVAPPRSVQALAPAAPILRLGSFSKTLAPGLRLGWMTGPATLVERIVGGGLLDAGGGLNPFVGLAVAAFAATGGYEPNVAALVSAYRARRDALVDALRTHIDGVRIDVPAGGYFAWVGLPGGLEAAVLRGAARAAGVDFLPAPVFDPGDTVDRTRLRLAFTFYDVEVLREGARRLGEVVAAALR